MTDLAEFFARNPEIAFKASAVLALLFAAIAGGQVIRLWKGFTGAAVGATISAASILLMWTVR